MAVNLRSYFFAAQAAIAQMKSGNGGVVINFSSVAYMAGMAGFPAYLTAPPAISCKQRNWLSVRGITGACMPTIYCL
jgi:NADP-dependent 3-hydroxy acid dehydrogenase YdfG